MEKKLKRGKIFAAYALVAGVLYLLVGIMEIFGIVLEDIFGGIMLLVI